MGSAPVYAAMSARTAGYDRCELSGEARTYARMIASLTEETEAIGWYAQRIALESDADSRAIMENAPAGGVQALRDGPRVPDPPNAEVEGRAPEDPVSPRATSSRPGREPKRRKVNSEHMTDRDALLGW